MKMKKLMSALLGASCIAASAGAGAATTALFQLPTPENNAYATYGTYLDALGETRAAIMMNGIPIALKYDDYWSYSAPLLNAIQSNTTQTTFLPVTTFGVYDFSVGTGTIAVNLTSNAGGATNVNPNGSGVSLQDPVDTASSDTLPGWTGVWGGNTQIYTEYATPPPPLQSYSDPASAQGGTSTVGEILTYLQTLDPLASIPVLYADYNQTGNDDSLWVSAMIQIWDETQTTMLGQWNLDRTDGSGLNIADPTFNYGTVNFYGSVEACTAAGPYSILTGTGCAGVTANGDEYSGLNHNKGSGKPDFLAFAPGMDLNLFDSSDLFVFTVNVGCVTDGPGPIGGEGSLGCNTNGGEEFGIVGAVASRQVPEPVTIALMGLGLLGLGWSTRGRRSPK